MRLLTSMILALIGSTLLAAQETHTAQDVFAGTRAFASGDAVNDHGFVEIGGIKQWVSVRGRHRSNPILLFLHGGPGFTTSPVSYWYMRDWEEFFTVVQWDQRGAGKTYTANDPVAVRPTMTLDRMVDDTDSVIEHLRRTYRKDRIFLVAHSFGTILGLKVAQQHPEWLYAYVGMGQFTDFERSEAMVTKLLLLPREPRPTSRRSPISSQSPPFLIPITQSEI